MIEMRICIVSFKYYRKNLRLLPWRYVFEFSQQFLNLGHEVVIVTDGYPELLEEDHIDNIPVIHLTHVKHFPPRNFKNIAKAISEIDPDIILWQMGLTNFFQKRLFDTLNYPIVALIGSPIYWRREIVRCLDAFEIYSERNLLTTSLAGNFLPRILTRSTLNSDAIKLVVVLSHETKSRLKKMGILSQKLVHIYPGVDTQFFRSSQYRETHNAKIDACKDTGKLLITYFGPPLLTRGIDTILKAVEFAIDRNPTLKYRLRVLFLFRIRQGEHSVEEKTVTKLFSRLKYKEVVKTKSGFLSSGEISAYLAATDLIVLPFKYVISDFPLGVTEAMSMGKLVISTTIDGVPELLEERRGILIEPGDFENLARIFEHFSKNEFQLNEYGKRAKQYMLERSTWKESAEKMLELFRTFQ